MNHRILIAAIAAALAVPGCAPASEEPVVVARAAAPEARAASWEAFSAGFIEDYFRHFPAYAVYQGRHEYDGRLPDWSEAGLNRKIAFLRETVAAAEAYDDAALTPEQQFARDYLISVAEDDLFWLADADQPRTNPAYYLNHGLDPNVYVARPYADAATRFAALTRFMRGVPEATAQIRANLRAPLPESFIDYGVAGFGGLADYYLGDAQAAFAGVDDPALQASYVEAATKASAAMQGLADWLESQRPNATQDFALGADRLQRMLMATEMVDTPLAELVRIGRADLKRNQAALAEACAKFAPGASIPDCMAKMSANKPEGGAVAGARAQLGELRAFVEREDLVSIPGTEQALVKEAPPYNRQNFAYIDIPGPFEDELPSVYYIAPPDPDWAPEVQAGYVPGEADLLFTSIHEVWPGHFLNFLHANRSPFTFGRIFVGYAPAEGWAHYAEEMMWEAGLGEGDPEIHIGQLSNALLRNCRFLSAIGMHTGTMTMEDSYRMFREECYQDEANARQQAARGTYDPAYLNYTMGKMMIRQLREDWTRGRGGRAAWKDFHDKFLSYGGPPIPLARAQMLGGEPEAVF